MIRSLIRNGVTHVKLTNVEGQRYIGTGLMANWVSIEIEGVPGEDLAAFMDGPTVVVHNNAQDGVGNTMNNGKVVVCGIAGDVVGYGMRGGRVYIQGDVGYRVGIHMKGYLDQQPIVVVGGKAGNFFGEYMAGGTMVLLGVGTDNRPVVGDYCATGMHGGTIYIRGEVEDHQLGKEVKRFPLDEGDVAVLKPILLDFVREVAVDEDVLDFDRYVKIVPVSTRPYGKLYAY
ncbi:MAG: hypothetical protein HY709_00265 [Candidatus Latescibacteria bacterium]|nr:hypothetical protein [Candidatus Latescibacterota bacterium]